MSQVDEFLTPTMLTDDENDNETAPRRDTSPTKPHERRHRRREMRRMTLAAASGEGTSEGKRVRTETEGPEVVVVPQVGTMSVTGRSRDMEDAICVKTELCRPVICQNKPVHFFGVYDGHGGTHVAALCRERMHVLLEDELSHVTIPPHVSIAIGSSSTSSSVAPNEVPKLPEAEQEWWWKTVVAACFQRMDDVAMHTCALCGTFGFTCGCHPIESSLTGSTAVVAVLTADHIIVANCGDSRAVLSRGGHVVPLSFDHKPERPDEQERIEASGGQVIFLNGARVDGILAMSRALGDKYLKPSVTSEPEITFTKRHKDDEFLILASDGLWDVISSELVCSVARECLLEGTQPAVDPRAGGVERGGKREAETSQGALHQSRSASAAALLTRLALGRQSYDNISVIVVDLKRSV